jgi:hypothetical protein
VPTTTTTTISGVSLFSGHSARAPERFAIVLSTGGIDFRRPKRPSATLTWDRVTDWEIETREDDVVLTLQGSGAATPLLIPGWSAADLDALLRQFSEQPAPTPAPDQVPEAAGPKGDTTAGSRGEGRPGVVELLGTSAAAADEHTDVARYRRRSRPLPPWKAVVTIVLLGVLATAVTIVLLQSAGIISWSFLGPTS